MNPAWTPTPERVAHANITAQMRRHGIADYDEFLRRATVDPDWFWRAFFADAGIAWTTPFHTTLDTSRGKPWCRWFTGGRFNWTQAALDDPIARGEAERTALVWEGEEGTTRTTTLGALRDEVDRVCRALHAMGVAPGDRVALWMPFVPEVAVTLLAVARMGAIAVPIFSGYGPEPAAVRLADSEASVVVTADAFLRKGAVVPLKRTVDAALAAAPAVRHVLVVRRLGVDVPLQAGRDRYYDDAIADHDAGWNAEAFDPETPWMLIYTSGTTGRPKGAVHVHAGFPVKAAQDMFHLFDVHAGDRISWLTDIGWMMGPWLIAGGLLLRATVCMYDGAADVPAPDRLWSMAERHALTLLGITPTLIRAVMKEGVRWPDAHAMPDLRTLGSTGEPWNPDAWTWTFEHIGKTRAPIINYSGGTEVSGGILGCTVLRPLVPCAFNTVNPGMDADCVNDQGASVRGEIGYLAIRNVNPGMTRGFWRDAARYEETYWSRWPGLWDHGDLVRVDADGSWYILGRADDTMKIAGKRVGPAEIEAVLAHHAAVVESAVVGVPDAVKGQRVVAFVVVRPNAVADDALRDALRALVAERMGKAFAPSAIHVVADLPKTRNAKIMRRVVRAAYVGEDTGDVSALENPAAVEAIRRCAP